MGAGRKPIVNPKRTITLYVDIKSIARFGDADTLKNKLYEFISGYNLTLGEALMLPEREIKPVEPIKVIPAPIPSVDPFEPAMSPAMGKFDEFQDRILAAVVPDELKKIMREVKVALLTGKEKQNLESIAKEHSANMYTD
jgi:hypothetical protein